MPHVLHDAPPDTNDVAACNRKVAFRSKASARNAAKRITRIFGHKQWPYECVNCGMWHLSKISPETVRRRGRGGR